MTSFGTSRKNNTTANQPERHCPYYKELMRKPMYFSCDEVYRRMGIAWEKKYPYYGKFMSANFPGSPYTMCFVAFCRTMENWCENPCIFHMVTLVHFFLWLRVNMYYFHTCIYINPILLWQSLSSWCVVDHLWKLTLRSLLCFLSTLFSCAMCNRTSVWVATKPLWW